MRDIVNRAAIGVPESVVIYEKEAVSAIEYKPSGRIAGRNVVLETVPHGLPIDVKSRKTVTIGVGERLEIPEDAIVLDMKENPEGTTLTVEYITLVAGAKLCGMFSNGRHYDRRSKGDVTVSVAVFATDKATKLKRGPIPTGERPWWPILEWKIPAPHNIVSRDEQYSDLDFYILGKLRDKRGKEIDGQPVDIQRVTDDNGYEVLWAGLSTEINCSEKFRINGSPLAFSKGARLSGGDIIRVFIRANPETAKLSWNHSYMLFTAQKLKY